MPAPPALPAAAAAAAAAAYGPGMHGQYEVVVLRADCQPSMGYFAQRIHVQDGVGGAGFNGQQFIFMVNAAAAAGNVVYVVFAEMSRFTASDLHAVLRALHAAVRLVLADLHAAAAAGYVPPGLLVGGTWLNIGSQVARAIFCLHLWAGHLLPRILVRLQKTAGQWA